MYPRKSNAKHATANTIQRNNATFSTPGHCSPIRAGDSQIDSSQGHLPEIEIEFAELQDGSLVELIQHPADPQKSLLAVYRDGAVLYTDKLRDGNRVLVPMPRADLVSKHVCLPQRAEAYVGVKKLIHSIASFFFSCLDVFVAERILMTAFVISSWFTEKQPVAPYLALVGPPSSGKTTALRILSLLCRRSLLTADITSAAFYHVCDRMHPTILIDETRTAGHQRTLLHLLRSSSSRGFVTLRKDTARLAYGPKVISWIELPNDAALNSRCIVIPMHKTARTDLMRPDDPNVLRCAAKVRMQLLQFRFEHYRNLSMPKVPADVQLSARALDLYRALAAPCRGDQKFCNLLAQLIEAQSQFQPTLLSPSQSSVLRVLYTWIHAHPIDASVRLKDIGRMLNSDLASLGEPSGLTERKTGDVLTSLGLTNRTRVNPGHYVVWLSHLDRERIHQKILNYGVDGIRTSRIQSCDICMKKDHVAGKTPRPKAVDQQQVCSDEPKRERRERHERRLGTRTRSTSGPLLR